MKIVKRDGRIVEYNSDKIRVAITKANAKLDEEKRVSDSDIEDIIKHIENLKKKRMLVEDIQDIIEERLMMLGKFDLAKHYIIYRYTRALVRKANTTDETILSLIKNNNRAFIENNKEINIQGVAFQRELIAREVSKDLTRRMLLPEKISKAHEDGEIYFHDMDYFLYPMINSCSIDVSNMLEEGIYVNDKHVESPKGFQEACTVLAQIITLAASGQYGPQTIELMHLGKYLRKSSNKYKEELLNKYKDKISEELMDKIVKDRLQEEIACGIQILEYQINTLIATTTKSHKATFIFRLEDEDEYIEENANIYEEILNYGLIGTLKFIYVLSGNNNLKGGKYDYLTKHAIKSTLKCGNLEFVSEKMLKEKHKTTRFYSIDDKSLIPLAKDGNNKNKYIECFNQGIVTINLAQIAIIANKNEKIFNELLEERLRLCFEALMCRHHSLLGTNSDVSPIHWQYGAIARLEVGEKIDEFLKDGHSTLLLGYMGLYEATKLMTGKDLIEEEECEFSDSLLQKLKDTCYKWTQDTGLSFGIGSITDDDIGMELIEKDRQTYGKIKDITDKESYMILKVNNYDYDEEKSRFDEELQLLK